MTREHLILFAVLVPSIICHEVAHGLAALALGDDTARRAGRITLNPLRHIDPFGTVLLPAMLALAGAPAFGYAKPVPVNPGRLRNPRQHSLYVSLAGPATNVALAVAAAGAIRFGFGHPYGDSLALEAVFYLGVANVLLATFNLLPIPPLDGSALIERLLPARWWPAWLQLRRYSMLVLLLVMLNFRGALSRVFDPALELWGTLL
ncbi:MAG: site-2 protease family protein [Acidimicrobiia bacterium]